MLKKVKLKPRVVGPLHGYLAIYIASALDFTSFVPLDGTSIVNAAGELVLGRSLHKVSIGELSSGSSIAPSDTFSLDCDAGQDGAVGVLDSCTGFVAGELTGGHVVDCVPEAIGIP